MSLQGPIVVVADSAVPGVLDALNAAGAFPIVEARRREIAAAIVSVQPAALILADPMPEWDRHLAERLDRVLAAETLCMPVIACVAEDIDPPIANALPVAAGAPPDVLAARLRAALRVRTLHASMLRRAEALGEQGIAVPPLPPGDPLDEASVLVAGRGRAYPALTTAIAERMGLIGALSLETAGNFLQARDIDGVVIGDGFIKRMVDDFIAD